jgi:hypothetical protein
MIVSFGLGSRRSAAAKIREAGADEARHAVALSQDTM